MTTVVIAAAVVAVAGLLAALQVLARMAQRIAFEAHLRPLSAVDRAGRPSQPPELVQLEGLVADAVQGDPAAAARLAARLAAIGVDPGQPPTPSSVVTALQALRPPATGSAG